MRFLGIEHDAPLICAIDKSRVGLVSPSRKHEIEIFLFVLFEVPHLVIHTKGDFVRGDVLSEQRTNLQQVEQDSPTRNLAVPITSRMILPKIAVTIFDARSVYRTGDNRFAVHNQATANSGASLCIRSA